MSMKWFDALEKRQRTLKEASLWRSRRELNSPQQAYINVSGSALVNFSSNDYLGLANLPELSSAACQQVQQWGIGSGASHLVCGHQTPHHKLEQSLAEFVGAERAILFSTGYMANIAVASALTSKHDLILQDKLNHASLIDGARLSDAKFKRYAHGNVEHAKTLLSKTEFDNALLMSDGVFSMDGNVAPLDELKQLADKEQALLLIDDAHGFACLGKSGRGALELFGLTPTGNILLMGTLGKALGSFGAFVAGDEIFIEQLIQSARSYIYTTALPPAVAGTSNAAVDYVVRNGVALRKSLMANINQFKEGIQEIGLELMPSDSAIQPLVLGDEQRALNFSQELQQRGFLVSAIRPPTVPVGLARLRFTFSAIHSSRDIDNLLVAIDDVVVKQRSQNDH